MLKVTTSSGAAVPGTGSAAGTRPPVQAVTSERESRRSRGRIVRLTVRPGVRLIHSFPDGLDVHLQLLLCECKREYLEYKCDKPQSHANQMRRFPRLPELTRVWRWRVVVPG